MILTRKAKEDFTDWCYSDIDRIVMSVPELSYHKNKIVQYALIIEWLDSIGYVIEISTMYYDGWHFTPTLSLPNGDNIIPNMMKESRQEATLQVIIRANEIYNKRVEL